MQGTARAFGERMCHEKTISILPDCSTDLRYLLIVRVCVFDFSNHHKIWKHTRISRAVLELIVRVSLQQAILDDLAFYARVVKDVSRLQALYSQNIKTLAKHYKVIIDGFGVPEHLITAPIAQDWVKYNQMPSNSKI